jgi:integrase
MAKPQNQIITYPPEVTNAIRLLLFTGCRLREILNLRWVEVDLERGLLHLPDSKTGRKTVVLNTAALDILSAMPRQDSYVVPSERRGQPRHDLKRPWDHIRSAAGLDDVRLHDLRHTHASFGVASGLGLPIIGRLLGHSSPLTTARYAHLADDPVRRASDIIGAKLSQLVG